MATIQSLISSPFQSSAIRATIAAPLADAMLPYRGDVACVVVGGEAPTVVKMRRRTKRVGSPQQWHSSLGRTVETLPLEVAAGDVWRDVTLRELS